MAGFGPCPCSAFGRSSLAPADALCCQAGAAPHGLALTHTSSTLAALRFLQKKAESSSPHLLVKLSPEFNFLICFEFHNFDDAFQTNFEK